MLLDEDIKTKVLDIFVPKVNYFGKTNVKWNESEIPNSTDILYFIYHNSCNCYNTLGFSTIYLVNNISIGCLVSFW